MEYNVKKLAKALNLNRYSAFSYVNKGGELNGN
jgi:hypothetical protein